MSTDSPAPAVTRSVDLDISGMTCSSCALRIEKKLNRVPGVEATVNYATERAHVECDPEMDPAELVAVVEATGYARAAWSARRAPRTPTDRPTSTTTVRATTPTITVRPTRRGCARCATGC